MKKILIILITIMSTIYASIGTISAVRGEVNIFRSNNHFLVQKGTFVEEKDVIQTSKGAKVQIIFNDQGVISLGQKSTFKIEKYLFTKKHKEAKFHVLKGAFKSITGKIGKIAPKKFQLKTKNATIGVRGTIFIGETSDTVDHIICSQGAIFITTPQGQITLRKGEKSTIRQNFAPSPAKKIEKQDMKLFKEVKLTNNIQLNKKIKMETPAISNVEFNNFKTKIEQNRQNWGEWNKEEILLKDINKKKNEPIEEKPAEEDKPIEEKPEEEDKPIEEERVEEPNIEIIDHFQDLIDRAGSATPSYHGQVQGNIKTNIDNSTTDILMDKNNNINLNFDLGEGSVNGDIAFQTQMQQNWSTQISGRVTEDGQFDFDSQKYGGGGDGQLNGDTLEKANGRFNLINEIQHGGIIHTAVGTFEVTKKGGE